MRGPPAATAGHPGTGAGPQMSNVRRAGRYAVPTTPQLDAYDSPEGTRVSGETSTQPRPPRATPDAAGLTVGGNEVLVHLGRAVQMRSPAGSPLQGDPGPGQIRGAAGGSVSDVRNWAGSASAGSTLANNLKAARAGKTGTLSYPG